MVAYHRNGKIYDNKNEIIIITRFLIILMRTAHILQKKLFTSILLLHHSLTIESHFSVYFCIFGPEPSKS